ncbi:catalase/hydroperoxidase HPI(I), partial [Escherichia coli O26:H11 str. CVM9942]
MIKKTLPVLILLALSGSFSTAVAADKKRDSKFLLSRNTGFN